MENGWLSGIGVVKFDVEYGNKLEILYPQSFWNEFSVLETKDIGYLAFPDSTTMNAQNEPSSLYCFKIRDYYVFVYFHQEKDPESPRGYKMESVLLFSKYPFLKLFKKVIRVVAASYFFISQNESSLKKSIPEKSNQFNENEVEYEGESSEDGSNPFEQNVTNFFERVFSETEKWPIIECNRRYKHLSFFKKVYNYKTPMMTIYDQPLFSLASTRTRSRSHSSPPNSLNVSFSPHTNRRRMERVKSVYQNEVNIYHTFRNHIKTLPKLWEILILNQGPILVLSPSPKHSSETILGLSTLIQPIPDVALDIRPYFTVNCSGYQGYIGLGEKFVEGEKNNGNKTNKEKKKNGNIGGKTVILGATNPFFLKAYVTWPHLLAIGEQIPREETTVVDTLSPSSESGISSDPSHPNQNDSKKPVTALKEKIATHLKSKMKKKKKREGQIILGCPESKKRGISERLMWEYEEIFVSSHKRFVINDSQLIKDMNIVSESVTSPSSPLEFFKFTKSSSSTSSPLVSSPSSLGNTTSNGGKTNNNNNNNNEMLNPFQNATGRNLRFEKRNNENIRKSFREWTILFLSPLQECFNQLKKLYLFPLFLKTEAEKILTLQKFFNYLKKNPRVLITQKRRIFKKKEAKDSVVLGFYKQFLTSQNFRAWLNLKINFEYYETLENIQLKKVVSSMNEVGVMDFFMRVCRDHRIQQARIMKKNWSKRVCDYIDPKVVKKLNVILMEIISLSPPILRPSMLKHIKRDDIV